MAIATEAVEFAWRLALALRRRPRQFSGVRACRPGGPAERMNFPEHAIGRRRAYLALLFRGASANAVTRRRRRLNALQEARSQVVSDGQPPRLLLIGWVLVVLRDCMAVAVGIADGRLAEALECCSSLQQEHAVQPEFDGRFVRWRLVFCGWPVRVNSGRWGRVVSSKISRPSQDDHRYQGLIAHPDRQPADSLRAGGTRGHMSLVRSTSPRTTRPDGSCSKERPKRGAFKRRAARRALYSDDNPSATKRYNVDNNVTHPQPALRIVESGLGMCTIVHPGNDGVTATAPPAAPRFPRATSVRRLPQPDEQTRSNREDSPTANRSGQR